jgi:hypothetical protein
LAPLLPAGQKFCKITQNQLNKENDWVGKLAAIWLPFFEQMG